LGFSVKMLNVDSAGYQTPREFGDGSVNDACQIACSQIQLAQWIRRMAKKGKLVLPALSEKPSLAALVVREDGRAAPELAQRWPFNLNCGAVTPRLDARTSV
jgi:hypothetical protein